MANPTAGVPVVTRDFNDTAKYWPLISTAQTFYPGEMIGLIPTAAVTGVGYADKYDDTKGMIFLGISQERLTVPSGGSNGDYQILVDKPLDFAIKLTSVADTDMGRPVWAAFSNEVQLTPGSFNNFVGHVVRKNGTNEALIRPWVPFGQQRGNIITRWANVATITTAGNVTLTAAQMLGGLILRDPNGANRSDTTPTAAALVAALPGVKAGDVIDLWIINTADAAEAVALTAGTGVTLVPATVSAAQDTNLILRLYFSNVGSGSEAVSIYAVNAGG